MNEHAQAPTFTMHPWDAARKVRSPEVPASFAGTAGTAPERSGRVR